jgi:rubrerythrin
VNDSALRELADDPSSRKRFLKMMGGAGAAASLSVFIAACGGDDDEPEEGASTTETEPTETGGDAAGDLEIVNYALTLEYLERDFYQAVLDSGAVTDPMVGELATSIRDNEQEHIDALIATAEQLDGTPAEQPKTDFEEVIAGGPEMILMTAATVENLGSAAYLGQAGAIQDKEILAAALAIHTVEARHAAALNQLAGRGFSGDGPLEGSIPDGAFAKPMTMEEVLEEIQPFLAS